ncbi:MAG: thioredoxin fold domain-containing protein [Planctomycetes bacterium]|nr:thioredoxin fold domain-containing protein [Planctomycetota bacterium]
MSLSVRLLMIAVLVAAPLKGLAETVLLDFSSPSCGPCQQMRPIVQRLVADGFRVQEVDISRDPQTAAQFGVTQVPTFIVLVDQRPTERLVGSTSYQQLRAMLLRATPASAPRRRAMPLGQSPEVSGTFAKPQAAGALGNPFGNVPPGPGALVAGSLQTSQPPSFHQRLLAATVKITVDDAQGKSVGTGTIVDARSGEALVLTCGHLFRSSEGKGPITVTTFQVGTTGATPSVSYSGHLIDFDLERDLALVSMRPTAPVQAVSIVGTGVSGLAPNVAVTSVGCNHGQDPTAIDSHVTSIDRYQGTPNVEVAGAPVEGRSGGGLFNSQGQLVGVCYAADPESNEGLYASLPAIYAKLDSLNLSMIYRPKAAGLQVAQGAPVPVSTPPQTLDSRPLVAVRGQEPEPVLVSARTQAIAALPAGEQAALEEIRRRGANSEVICIIRSHDPGGKSEVITINNASPAFVRALTGPTAPQPSATAAAGRLLR